MSTVDQSGSWLRARAIRRHSNSGSLLMSAKPLIIAIDDDESEVRPKISTDFQLEIIDPRLGDDQFSGQLAGLVDRASLILLDHKFWDQPRSLSLHAADGASFVAHLR